ncbi:ROK family glucokinase [soil metagenome]
MLSVDPRPAEGVAVGVDIGGTKLAGGLIGADGSVLARDRVDTPAHDADAIVEAVLGVVERLTGACEPGTGDSAPRGVGVPVGVGAAGMIDLGGTVRYAPNLDWSGCQLGALLTRRLGVTVTVDNDGNAAAWGEYRCGAGRDTRASLVMLTVGTGVGGGLIHNGTLLRGAQGFGAEFGHMVIAEGGRRCPCGNTGCLEALASGTAIGITARERRESGGVPTDSPLHHASEPTGKSVTIAAHAGDEAARAVLAECGAWLGVGIASLVNALDPEMVVVGGGAMDAGELLLAPAREAAVRRLMGRSRRQAPPIVRAGLADDGGLVGAALLALEAGAGHPRPATRDPV